jgi:hypothetical protein
MSSQPTLRHGDHEADGWVKYLQEMLAFHLHDSGIAASGTFDDATLEAVKKFQHQAHLREDGIVGDATWAALTQDKPAHEGTDHLAPHTHLDAGTHVVWSMHGGHDDGVYKDSDDSVMWIASVVGNTPIPTNTYTASVEITVNGQRNIEFIELQSVGGKNESAPGELMSVTMTGVKATYGSGTHQYLLEMPSDLGDSKRQGEFTVP